MTTETSIEERQVAMFGVTSADMQTFVERNVGPLKLFATPKDAAFSILSDAQEEMAMGMTERARKSINRAKWLIDQS